MSTTKTFTNIKSGKRHQIDATARGYYDFRTTVVPQPNKPLSFDMRVYDGLNYAVDLSKNSVRPGEINFDGTVLPYIENNTLSKTNYCFGNSGTNYDLPVYEEVYSNITKVGNVNINNDIASGFSSSNYFTIKKRSNTMTVVLKIITGSDLNTPQRILFLDKWVSFTLDGYSFRVENFGEGTEGPIGPDLSVNTEYVWKFVLNSDGSRVFSYSTDGGTNYTEAANFTDTGVNWSDSQANTFYLGINNTATYPFMFPFKGKVDLVKSSIQEKLSSGDFIDYKLNSTTPTSNPTGTYESKIGIFQDYEDNGQANKLNCFSNNNQYTVLSPNENIIYYMKHQYKDWIQPILSSDGTMGGDLFAVNSSSILRAGREAYKAFDGDTSTIDDNWHSSQGHPSWIEWYNPNPLKITRIKIQNRNSADGGSFVNTYKLSYSDDYSNWVDLLSGTSPSQENFTYWNIDITEENPHKYWRLTCLTSSGSNSDYTSIQTISITAQEYVSLKGTPDDYDEIVKYTYLGTVDIPKHNIYNVDNFYGWSNNSKSIFTKTLQLSTDIPLYNSSYKQQSTIINGTFTTTPAEENGIVSSFNGGILKLTFTDQSTEIRFYSKVNPSDRNHERQIMGVEGTSNNIGRDNNVWRLWNGSGHYGSAFDINTDYWVCLVDNRSGTYTMYVLKDNNYTKDTLPEITSWNKEFEFSGSFFKSTNCVIGGGISNGSIIENWTGTIDLNNTWFESGNSKLWEGTSELKISSFTDNSITLTNNEVYIRNNTLDKHVVLSTSASGGEVNPPSVDPSTLKFGDRIDNRATVVGTYESSDLGKVVFALLDSSTYGISEWAYDLYGINTDLPDDLSDSFSATHNTNYIISTYGDKIITAFKHCRQITPLNFNNRAYKCQLPNLSELTQIFNNRSKLYQLDPTASSNESYNLRNWKFGSVSMAWSSNECYQNHGYAFSSNGYNSQLSKRGDNGLAAVLPIIEIKLS